MTFNFLHHSVVGDSYCVTNHRECDISDITLQEVTHSVYLIYPTVGTFEVAHSPYNKNQINPSKGVITYTYVLDNFSFDYIFVTMIPHSLGTADTISTPLPSSPPTVTPEGKLCFACY